MSDFVLHMFRDNRGDLIPIPFNELPFEPKHMFVVSNNPGPVPRGAHAHKTMKQILFCVQGSFQIQLEKQNSKPETHLLQAGQFVFHDCMEWANIFIQTPGTVIISLCDRAYDEDDVIRDSVEFFYGKK